MISSKAMGSFLHLTFRLSTNEGRALATLKPLLGIEKSKELDQLGDEPGPSRLVACAQPCAVIPMEVLVEENVIPPVGVGLELLRAAINMPPAMFVAGEGPGISRSAISLATSKRFIRIFCSCSTVRRSCQSRKSGKNPPS